MNKKKHLYWAAECISIAMDIHTGHVIFNGVFLVMVFASHDKALFLINLNSRGTSSFPSREMIKLLCGYLILFC